MSCSGPDPSLWLRMTRAAGGRRNWKTPKSRSECKEQRAKLRKSSPRRGDSAFDAPLHGNSHHALEAGGSHDIGRILDGTLMQQRAPAVTLVANHDTQPLQDLESPVEYWFKPPACAIIRQPRGEVLTRFHRQRMTNVLVPDRISGVRTHPKGAGSGGARCWMGSTSFGVLEVDRYDH